jgi:hypothetical protein
MLARLALVLALVSFAAPLRARAQDDVHELLAAAVSEYDGHNYEEAYALFTRVHDLSPTARSERALGKTAFELRRYRECVQWLEASLADERSPLTDEMRVEVMGLLTRARAFLGHFTLHASVESASIDIDGAPASATTVELDLGDHEIVAHAEGCDVLTRRVTVHGGENETIELTLVHHREEGGSSTPSTDPGGVYRDFGWAGLLTGIALVVGGAVATGIWASTVGTLNANIDSGACTVDASTDAVLPGNAPTCFDLQNRYRVALPFAYVGFIAGGALMAMGLGLILGAPSAATEQRAGETRCTSFADIGVRCTLAF